jgi:hypothetical protein
MTKSTRTRTRTNERTRTLLRFKSITGRRRQRQEQAYVQRRRGHRFRCCPVRTPVRRSYTQHGAHKAARRIHKKNPSSCSSSPRVLPHSERELYMYDVTMVKDPKPRICDFRGGYIRSHRGWYTEGLSEEGSSRPGISPARLSTSQAGYQANLPISSTCLCVHPVKHSVVIPGPLPLRL